MGDDDVLEESLVKTSFRVEQRRQCCRQTCIIAIDSVSKCLHDLADLISKENTGNRTPHICHDLHAVEHFHAGKFFDDSIQDPETPSEHNSILWIILCSGVAID